MSRKRGPSSETALTSYMRAISSSRSETGPSLSGNASSNPFLPPHPVVRSDAKNYPSHVKPAGYVELQCIHPHPQSDDNSTPETSGVVTFSRRVIEASEIAGVSLRAPTRFREWLEEAGFEDVIERRFKVPTAPWPKEERMKLIGAFETQSLLEGAQAFSLRVFAKAFGWSQAETETFLVPLRKDVKNLRHHTYYELWVKPGP